MPERVHKLQKKPKLCYTMCMHTLNGDDIDRLLAAVGGMDAGAIDRVRAAVDRRRRELKRSAVLERRDYRDGVLQLETRAYKRKDGELTERGPYWYFHWREGGRQRTLYVGKTDGPEAVVDAKLKGEDDG